MEMARLIAVADGKPLKGLLKELGVIRIADMPVLWEYVVRRQTAQKPVETQDLWDLMIESDDDQTPIGLPTDYPFAAPAGPEPNASQKVSSPPQSLAAPQPPAGAQLAQGSYPCMWVLMVLL